MTYTRYYETPIGGMILESDGEALTALRFENRRQTEDISCGNREEQSLPVLVQTAEWLELYFGGQIPDFLPPLKLQATEFRRAVWEILLTIPYGETTTYGEIARKIAIREGKERMSAQAVGGAVGSNPIALIIPCHRVIGADGSLTGYAAGVDKKEKLLALEKDGRRKQEEAAQK